MFNKEFFDIKRFKSIEEARKRREIYAMDFTIDEMVIIDPDLKEHRVSLDFPPGVDLHKNDLEKLYDFLNEDMKKRNKRKKKV